METVSCKTLRNKPQQCLFANATCFYILLSNAMQCNSDIFKYVLSVPIYFRAKAGGYFSIVESPRTPPKLYLNHFAKHLSTNLFLKVAPLKASNG